MYQAGPRLIYHPIIRGGGLSKLRRLAGFGGGAFKETVVTFGLRLFILDTLGIILIILPKSAVPKSLKLLSSKLPIPSPPPLCVGTPCTWAPDQLVQLGSQAQGQA